MDRRRYFKITTQMALCLRWASAWPIRESWWACWQVWRNYRERTSRMEEIASEILQNNKFWGSREGNGDNLAPQKASEYSDSSYCTVDAAVTTINSSIVLAPTKSRMRWRNNKSSVFLSFPPKICKAWVGCGWGYLGEVDVDNVSFWTVEVWLWVVEWYL